LKSLIHYSQLIKERDFAAYNFIEDAENTAAYGSAEVPEYPIESIDTTPVMLVSAHKDYLASDYDIEWLYDELVPNYAGDADAEVVLVNIRGRHATYVQGEDMDYFSDIVLPWVAAQIPADISPA